MDNHSLPALQSNIAGAPAPISYHYHEAAFSSRGGRERGLALSGMVVDYGHGIGGSPVTSYRSQAARAAARSSRAMLGDLAGLPLLISAPCSHCEQISTRGSDAARHQHARSADRRFGLA